MPHFTVLEFDNNYDFVNGYVIKSAVLGNIYMAEIRVDKNKRVMYSISENLVYPDIDAYLGFLNSNGQIQHQRRKEYRNREVFYNNFEIFGDDSYVFTNDLATVGQSNFFLEYSKLHNSDTGSVCLGLQDNFSTIEPVVYLPYTFNWAYISDTPFVETVNQNNLSLPIIYTASSPCIQVSVCDTLKIHGQGVVCSYQQNLVFTAYKNPACGSFVNWSIPPAVVQQLQILNDTTVQIRLNQPWQGWLYATISAACGQFSDSIFITAGTAPGPVNIGPDKQICSGNTVTVNAGSGYVSYLWNTGSINSSITVSLPGTYYVDVVDACGQLSSDTIVLSAAPPIPFSIGPDRIKCNADTLHLNATGGFLNYTWGPNYNISSLITQNVIVQPAIDTIYFVKAEKTPGCFAFDTVRVTVKNSPVINLGADISFCNGDSSILDAGSGFNQYVWSNGSISAQTIVHNAGAYSVIGIAANGCKSYDTLNVSNVWPSPIVSLTNDTELCIGQTRTYNAGVFNSYLWQDGSNNQIFIATGTGVYYVTVTDNHGCKGSDTSEIKTMLIPPSGFLPADSSICSYSTIKISATGNFSDYIWNTGSTSPVISINQAGIYWLEVTDSKTCKGRDTIVITLKQCTREFYVPSAFTPNGDTKNDLFKPSIFGTVKQYEFIVYNRYGEIIFKTKELSKGWDGTIKGKAQNPGVFVWKCTYQIDNMMVTTDQGTVMLIR